MAYRCRPQSLGGVNKSLNAVELKKKLPHRYPMAMIDTVESVGPDTAVAWKNVTVNEPHFPGHFPNAPVMPGVLVMEALCQLVWLWAVENGLTPAGEAGGVRMTGIQKLRFRRPTLPGDLLKLEVEISERTEQSCVAKVVASVEEQPAVVGQLIFEIFNP